MDVPEPHQSGICSDTRSPLSGLRAPDAGFSFVELLLVLAAFGVLTATALSLVLQANRSLQHRLRSSTLVDTGLTALAQMSREIRMAGFPSAKSFAASAVAAHPGIVASSFVTVSSYDLVFEADTDSDGRVEQIEYVIFPGTTSIMRHGTLKNANGTLATGSTISTTALENVRNQLQGQPLFTWDIEPLSTRPFPQNIRTVYINAVLAMGATGSSGPISATLSASCQRLNP